MAEEVNYRIIIENHAQEGETPVSTDSTNGGTPAPASPVTEQKTKVNKGFLSNVMVATNVIKPYVQQAISFGVSQVEMETGSASLQRRAQAYSSIGSSAISIVTAGIMGGAAGAAGAAGVMLLQTMIESAMNAQTIQNQKQMEQENIALRKSRAGLSINRSREGGVV